MLYFNSSNSNVLAVFLKELQISYTTSFVNQLYEKHPFKYNLLGLSRMLHLFSVPNMTIKIEEKADSLDKLSLPFIAYVKNDFFVVKHIKDKYVYYSRNGQDKSIDKFVFLKDWSGVALMAQKNENSVEPNYSEHRKKEKRLVTMKLIFIFLAALIFFYYFLTQKSYENEGFLWFLILNLIGLCVSIMIVGKKNNKPQSYGDKLCHLFKKGNCNDVLDSNASKLAGIWSWGNIGVTYFLANLIILSFFPSLIFYLAFINVFTLPYTIWSVWYQKFEAKQWCPLCLIIQGVLWLLFLTCVYKDCLRVPFFFLDDIFKLLLVGFLSFCAVEWIVFALHLEVEHKEMTWNFNRLKASSDVFELMCKKEPCYPVERTDSCILFGNKEAPHLLTFITNPHCLPCAEVHQKIDDILEYVGDRLCIQYIFVSFNKDLEKSALCLIKEYLSASDEKNVKNIYSTWYRGTENDKKKFLSKFDDVFDENVMQVYTAHKTWCDSTNLHSTPTLLWDGRKLPSCYTLDDFIYLLSENR